MGGCYESSCSYTPQRVQATDEQNFKEKAKEFFTSKDLEVLRAGYKTLLQRGKEAGWIKLLHEAAGVKKLPKEFQEYEIEAKFKVQLTKPNKGRDITMQEVMDAF